jgi:hypothetical protein
MRDGIRYLDDGKITYELLEDIQALDIYFDDLIGFVHESGWPIAIMQV